MGIEGYYSENNRHGKHRSGTEEGEARKPDKRYRLPTVSNKPKECRTYHNDMGPTLGEKREVTRSWTYRKLELLIN
jgi:hypothetical protein